jgi:hypothetical protein
VVSSGKSKIGEFAGHALVSNQDVLWLEVPVVDSNGVAVLNGIQDLEEGALDKIIIANVLALLGDVGEQVTFWAVLDYDIGAVWSIHDLDQRNYIGVSTGLVVELDLPLLELPLARLKTNLVERFYGIGNVCLDVHGSVDYSIGAYAQDASQLQPSSEDLT